MKLRTRCRTQKRRSTPRERSLQRFLERYPHYRSTTKARMRYWAAFFRRRDRWKRQQHCAHWMTVLHRAVKCGAPLDQRPGKSWEFGYHQSASYQL